MHDDSRQHNVRSQFVNSDQCSQSEFLQQCAPFRHAKQHLRSTGFRSMKESEPGSGELTPVHLDLKQRKASGRASALRVKTREYARWAEATPLANKSRHNVFFFMHHKRLPLRQWLLRRRSIYSLIFADQLNRNNLPPVEFRLIHQPLTQRRPQHFVAPREHRKLKLKVSKPQQIDEPVCLQRLEATKLSQAVARTGFAFRASNVSRRFVDCFRFATEANSHKVTDK